MEMTYQGTTYTRRTYGRTRTRQDGYRYHTYDIVWYGPDGERVRGAKASALTRAWQRSEAGQREVASAIIRHGTSAVHPSYR